MGQGGVRVGHSGGRVSQGEASRLVSCVLNVVLCEYEGVHTLDCVEATCLSCETSSSRCCSRLAAYI
jgi:hypothetical protein